MPVARSQAKTAAGQVAHTAALMLGVLVGPLEAATPADPPDSLPSAVEQLVEQLDADQLSDREVAERKLAEMGPGILSLLPAGDSVQSAEVRHRLSRIRSQLQRARSDLAERASRVSLNAHRVPLSEAMADIERQTANKAVFGQGVPEQTKRAPMDIALQDVPYWLAMDQILDLHALTTYHFSRDPALILVPAAPGQASRYGRACYAGPFRFEAVRVDAFRELRQPDRGGTRIQLEIAWEPRLAPISMSQPLKEVQALGEDGSRLQVSDPEVVLAPSLPSGSTAAELRIPLKPLPRTTTTIKKLSGLLRVLLPGAAETFRFSDVQSVVGQQIRRGNALVTLENVRKNNALWEIRIGVRYRRTSGALESHRGWIYGNECFLLDASGERVDFAGLETTRQSEFEVGLAYLFDLPAGLTKATLVYRAPGTIVESAIRYELSGIRLP